jgi:hypothetical protein
MRRCGEDGCGAKHYARGLCSKHYQRRWGRGDLAHAPRHQLTAAATLDERLRHHGWHVTESGCWEWAKSLNSHGYGQLAVGGKRPEIASRAAYAAWVGPILDGAYVCHRCDNPPCINPKHLFLGADLDNISDMNRKGRHSHGERKPNHKLTDAQVAEIRARYAAGGIFQRELAAAFGVSQQLVQMLVVGKRRTRPTVYPDMSGGRSLPMVTASKSKSERTNAP